MKNYCALLMLVSLCLAGCSKSFNLLGKQCPCITGYECDPATNTCVPEGTLDASFDAPDDSDEPEPDPLAATAVSLGSDHACALFEDSKIVCWGKSSDGQLGYGRSTNVGDDEVPKKVGFVSVGGNVVHLVTGNFHSCAVLEDGTVRCWGLNSFGQLGNGDTDTIGDDTGEHPASLLPVDVGGTVVQIAAGYTHTCALFDTGSMRCWGGNHFGQLGYGHDNSTDNGTLPSELPTVSVGGNVKQIAAGYGHTCALLNSGNMRCWGLNSNGKLGHGHTDNIGDDELPSEVSVVDVGEEVSSIAANGNHTCALLSTGDVRCWGDNGNGQLGNGDREPIGDDELPSSVPPLNFEGKVTQIAAGYRHTCALLENGTVRCWGANESGELGYGHTMPVGDELHSLPGDQPVLSLGGTVKHLASGFGHTCAVLDTGTVRCWGENDDGELGYGDMKTIGDNELPSSAGPASLR